MTVDADGAVAVRETGDHLGRTCVKIGGVGLVVGLLSPPLLAATVVGGSAGDVVERFAKHGLESELGDKPGAALSPGTAGIVAIYDREKADTVSATLADLDRADRRRRRQGAHAALAEAQAGMGG